MPDSPAPPSSGASNPVVNPVVSSSASPAAHPAVHPAARAAGSSPWLWLAPYAAVLVFALAMLALVLLLQQREGENQRSALTRDLHWAEQTLRLHMQTTEEFLFVLARDLSNSSLESEEFQLRASQHLASTGELTHIAWIGSEGQERWSAPMDTIAWSNGNRPSAQPLAGFERVRESGRMAYGPIYRNTLNAEVFEVHAPVRIAGEFEGTVVAVYSLERILDFLTPGWFGEKYRLALTDPEGQILAARAGIREVDAHLTRSLALDPPGNGLHLEVQAFRSSSNWVRTLPVVLVLGLSLVLLWTLWLLRSFGLRQVQIEKERDRLFNLSLDMLCVMSLEGAFKRCNPAFEAVLGHPPKHYSGRTLLDFVHRDDLVETLVALRALAGGARANFENRMHCADGSIKWLMWSANPVPEEGLLYAVAHDISGRKATEEALRAESAFRNAMEESVLTGLRAIDREGRIIYVNTAFCRLVGFSREELIGACAPFPYWPAGELPLCQRHLDMTLAGEAPASGFEMRIARKDGQMLDARFYLSPLIDSSGRHTGWMASVTDITEPKRVRAALEAAHERFTAVLDGLDVAVFVADARSEEILYANRAFKAMHGFDAIGRTVRAVGVPQPERGEYRSDPQALETADLPRELFDGELRNPLSGRWYQVREQATRWVDGRVVRMSIATDITDHKHTSEVAREQEERLQRTSRLITMGEMASTLAHELNQPLSAIANYCSGCVTRLKNGNGREEDLLAAMHKASEQAERAGKIIRRVREFVKKSEPRRSAVNLAEIFEDALSFAEIDARRLGIRIVTEFGATPLPPVHADRIMIEQVLLNLVKNGMEAMNGLPAAQRVLTLRAAPARQTEGMIEISVADCGHGVSELAREHLFSPFFTTKPQGMGMGLNICRTIVEYHDGRLWLQPNPAGGTVFSFTLPMEPADSVRAPNRISRRA